MSIYNSSTNNPQNTNRSKGILIYYSNYIGYNFYSNINYLIQNSYDLIKSTFKAMYTLISKPVFVITPDKIIIQLFYYIRSENTIFSYLKKLALRYKIIQKLILNTYNSDPLIAKNNFKNITKEVQMSKINQNTCACELSKAN